MSAVDKLGLRPILDFLRSGELRRGLPKVAHGDHRPQALVDHDLASYQVVAAVFCGRCRSSASVRIPARATAADAVKALAEATRRFRELPESCRDTQDLGFVRDVMDS